MGGGIYTDTAYTSLRSRRVAEAGVAAFTHDRDVREGRVERGVHARLSPHNLRVREARDSAEHPASLPVAPFFDVTGSMGHIPRRLQEKLPSLMGLLLSRGYAVDPQVMFGAIGDAHSDDGPLQLGQFESDVQMDEDLDKVWLEGGGGGGTQGTPPAPCESYELAYYFAARHTAIDSWEKRQKKGYLFTIGDEAPYQQVTRTQVRSLFGSRNPNVTLQANIATADIVAEARERWHLFHLVVTNGSAMRSAYGPIIVGRWRELLGEEHVVEMPDHDHVAEIIAVIVGLSEGRVTMDRAVRDLAEMGIDPAAVEGIQQAVDPFARAVILRS